MRFLWCCSRRSRPRAEFLQRAYALVVVSITAWFRTRLEAKPALPRGPVSPKSGSRWGAASGRSERSRAGLRCLARARLALRNNPSAGPGTDDGGKQKSGLNAGTPAALNEHRFRFSSSFQFWWLPEPLLISLFNYCLSDKRLLR